MKKTLSLLVLGLMFSFGEATLAESNGGCESEDVDKWSICKSKIKYISIPNDPSCIVYASLTLNDGQTFAKCFRSEEDARENSFLLTHKLMTPEECL